MTGPKEKIQPSIGGRFRRLFALLPVCAVIVIFIPAIGLCQQQPMQPRDAANTQTTFSAPPDVAAPPADAKINDSGMAAKVLKPGSGVDHPVDNDCVRVRFTAWKRDGRLFSTSTSSDNSEVLCLNDAILGVAEALKEMVVGEQRRVWIPSDLTFREAHHHAPKKAEDKDPLKGDLTFDMELLSIMKAPPTPAELGEPPADAVKTPSGLAYKVLKSGSGTKHPSMTSTVLLHFSGWKKNGKLFESTVMGGHPALVSLALAMPGWREGLPLMVVGEKARFWIPADLAYGEKPADRFNPAGELVYDIELLAVQ